ncbi:hypothetical protein J0X19_20195 [Hymenobacter sp. BT186]|uniref:Lipoprotein n=1 Tax=Hymenobacter telluris TaxID=2816474 RepID=A0A939F0Y0_9BACT|nr:DUF5694 domain-containing protein [Hymenobacter telluris]MBO0360292.1 hypothetical protein [Hymenobacter telluris]MBW3376319.1 hypothetical protein [Hymenobacter norwichensis]
MRQILLPCLVALASLAACTTTKNQPVTGLAASTAPVAVMLVGGPHLAQVYKATNPNTDVLTPKRQTELEAVRAQLQRYRPDAILVEELPERQPHLDSLYALYRQGRLDLNTLPGGRSETYQLGFVLGKQLGLERIYCVNAPGSTSQSILHEGTNIKLYQDATAEHRAYGGPKMQAWETGNLSMGGLLAFTNSPALLQQLHTLVYRTPARVTDGTLKPDPMVDAGFISPHYVGAEFISVFYNRDLKIYSNIVTTQLATRKTRLLTIIGARHIGSLQGMFRTDPAYQVVEASKYLKP